MKVEWCQKENNELPCNAGLWSRDADRLFNDPRFVALARQYCAVVAMEGLIAHFGLPLSDVEYKRTFAARYDTPD